MSGRVVQSARGLFRATGRDSAERPRAADDFYPTPPEPTRALLSAERGALSRFAAIWEPAAGDGAMAREIEAAGWGCFPSDLVDRGAGAAIRSFYDFDAAPCRAIVTNPPYSEVNWRDGRGRWIEHALNRLGVSYMALLLSWSWPGAAGLGRLWSARPPARVYLMRWKIDFTGEGAPPVLNGWFIWDDAAPAGPTQLLMMDRADARQGEMFQETEAP